MSRLSRKYNGSNLKYTNRYFKFQKELEKINPRDVIFDNRISDNKIVKLQRKDNKFYDEMGDVWITVDTVDLILNVLKSGTYWIRS